MPSWPTRLHLGSPAPSPGSKSRAPRGPSCREEHIEENMDHDQPLHGVPVLASTKTSSPSRPSHGRSNSHPFPAIFGSGRKAEKMTEPVDIDEASETLAESIFTSTRLASKDQVTANLTFTQNEQKEFVTGKCATCDSLIRWPRLLDAFRCTVCLMVNDLKPGARSTMEGREAEGSSAKPALPRRGATNSRMILRTSSNIQQESRIYPSIKLEV